MIAVMMRAVSGTVQTRRPVRIAMWSGPRNISTALMRSFGSRADTIVCDEPFYGYYLRTTGREHPGRDEVIASQAGTWDAVVADLLRPLPRRVGVFYQKHMCHHIDAAMPLDWLGQLSNCFLIREPRAMLASLLRVLPDAGLADTGLPQQLRLFEHVRANGQSSPPVLDSRDVLLDPERCLTRLCERLGIPFSAAMLAWSPGPRASDGVWARHWYAAVERSTGFAPWRDPQGDLPAHAEPLLERCEAIYRQLYACRLAGPDPKG